MRVIGCGAGSKGNKRNGQRRLQVSFIFTVGIATTALGGLHGYTQALGGAVQLPYFESGLSAVS